MRRTLSIGAKWTLRYVAVMLITTSAFSAYVYNRAEKRIDQDAGLLMELQLAQLIEHMDATPGAVGEWREYADLQVSSSDPELRLGIEFFDPDGRRLVSVGAASMMELPLPKRVLLGKADPGVRKVEVGWGYPYLVLSGRGEQGIAQLMIYSRPFARSAAGIRDAFMSALPVMLLLTAGLGYLLSRGSLRPIATITRSAHRISSLSLQEKIPTTGSGDELDELAGTLNDMLARIREGVERMRRFSGDAAHQLRTPLNAMQSELDVTLAKERSPAEYRVVLGDLLHQVVTLSDTVNAILRLAQSEGGLDPAHTVRVAIDPLLEDVVDFFAVMAEERGIELVAVAESKGAVRGDPTWLHQLFANLIHNALQYTPDGGRVAVEARPASSEVLVRVRDTGPGMSEADRAIAFSRFQRGSASPSGEGLGLGLALAREIARAHGGSIEIEAPTGRGAVFAVRLPLAPAAAR
ncbi:MAG: ATP-binding protein [Proteobacteria bacterium]|nr:ATP-binding protein [Pseudomonadota bacterium]